LEYYIEPAEQTEEVKQQFASITPDTLNIEEITLIDPACGSGHILVEAYELFKSIYQTQGYRSRDIPQLILEKNLFGLDIDDRAAQLSSFALMMKAREDDKRIFTRGVQLNVMSMQESSQWVVNSKQLEVDADQLLMTAQEQERQGLLLVIKDVLELFKQAKTQGSLIEVPESISEYLPTLDRIINQMIESGDLFSVRIAQELQPFVKQAMILSQKYDVVVANPPYMGLKGMNRDLSSWLKKTYPNTFPDLMTVFMERSLLFSKRYAFWSMINLPSWMFLGTFEKTRNLILANSTVSSLLHLGRGIFGSDFGSVAFVFQKTNNLDNFNAVYRRLFDKHVEVRKPDVIQNLYMERNYGYYAFKQKKFHLLPGKPIAYWIDEKELELFDSDKSLSSQVIKILKGMFTGDNNRFLRNWYEVDYEKISKGEWKKYNKAGGYRKWSGIALHVVDWRNDGYALKNFDGSGIGPIKHFGKPHIVWGKLTASDPSFRMDSSDIWFDDASPGILLDVPKFGLLAFLNSNLIKKLLGIINPTVNYQAGDISKLPCLPSKLEAELSDYGLKAFKLSNDDWIMSEITWGFKRFALNDHNKSLDNAFDTYLRKWD